MGRFSGKVAVIIGGTSGIGLATAQRLSAGGCKVFVTGRRQAALDRACAALGGIVRGVIGDVAILADLDHLFDVVRAEGDPIDMLIVNAASIEPEMLGTISEEALDRQLGVNVKGAIFAVQKALQSMRDGGAIVLVSSIAAHKGMPAHSVYGASKAAVRSLARTWAWELKPRRIRVNVVTPGPTDTPGSDAFIPDAEARQAFDAHMALASPNGRIGTSDEIANVIAFVASDAARYVNGADFQVDGGLSQI